MRIGIIGGGAAGVITAWLLEQDHDVTLFERDTRLGGHCHSVAVELNGRTHHVDAGIHYFSDPLQPTFMKLLRQLQAPFISYHPNATFHDSRSDWNVCMPPFGSIARMGGLAQARTLNALLGLRKVIQCAVELVEGDGDFYIPLEEFVSRLLLPPRFTEGFLYPYLGSFWGVSADEVRTYSARNVLSYLVLLRPPVVSPLPSFEMVGGMSAYIDLLVRDMNRASLHTGATIEEITRNEGRYQVTANGEVHEFDHLVIATNAAQAHSLLQGLPGMEAQRGALALVDYFDTTIAIHGDPTFMPPNRAHWSTVNGMYDGEYCSTTDRCHGNRNVDLFRSWITHSPRKPNPCYAEITFQHPRPTPAYFRCQTQLDHHQGKNNLWLAGMYATNYDSHEGVVRSALRVAEALAPHAERLSFTR
jgi:predicted NAD/FAD-binding protein